MLLEVKEEGEVLILRLKGELDLDTVDMMREKTEDLLEKKESLKGFILNLKGMTFVDSAGIGAILGRFKRVESLGGVFFVTHLTPQLERLFHLAGMLTLFQVACDEDEALARINASRKTHEFF